MSKQVNYNTASATLPYYNSSISTLHEAAFIGDIDLINHLLDGNADPNAQNAEGTTPLHYASWWTSKKVIKLLLDRQADPNIQDIDKQTPLHYAPYYRDKRITELLLDRNANPDIQDNEGHTALHHATYSMDTETIKLLLKKKANPNIMDIKKETPLHHTVYAFTKHLDNLFSINNALNMYNEDIPLALERMEAPYIELIKLFLVEDNIDFTIENNKDQRIIDLMKIEENKEYIKSIIKKDSATALRHIMYSQYVEDNIHFTEDEKVELYDYVNNSALIKSARQFQSSEQNSITELSGLEDFNPNDTISSQ
ncbi:MAG: ankyrin repeat domain-containing protein [Rickettsiaceae bacterium]|nr:ankyrin repeat domain-containing protein [Rickettsiaceae bacterium]